MSKHTRHLDSIIPGHALGIKVVSTKKRPDGDIHAAIGKWKRAVKDAGIIDSVKDRKEYTKESVRRRREISRAKYMQQINDQNNY
mgnify:CR=1 FL=1